MTNIFKTPEKAAMRVELFQNAVEALEKQGWTVERIPREGKSSVRRITKDGVTKTVSIRTTQDKWIAFPRNNKNDGWATLRDVDYVVAASVDDRDNPRFAQIHMIEGDEMRARFDRAYAARKAAGFVMPEGRGIWVSLYEKESNDPVSHVGAGAGLAHPPIARVPLTGEKGAKAGKEMDALDVEMEEAPLTIAEAKRRLALSLGVNETDIKITINS
ncbi:MAG: hypothetical protein ACLQNV_17360 [Steroidobacteraceae bacterium]